MTHHTLAQSDPRVPGGRYLSGYWRQEYRVDTIFTRVDPFTDDHSGFRWLRGTTFYDVTWIPAEDSAHPRVSQQWADDGYRRTRHCTPWDARQDVIVSQPSTWQFPVSRNITQPERHYP